MGGKAGVCVCGDGALQGPFLEKGGQGAFTKVFFGGGFPSATPPSFSSRSVRKGASGEGEGGGFAFCKKVGAGALRGQGGQKRGHGRPRGVRVLPPLVPCCRSPIFRALFPPSFHPPFRSLPQVANFNELAPSSAVDPVATIRLLNDIFWDVSVTNYLINLTNLSYYT